MKKEYIKIRDINQYVVTYEGDTNHIIIYLHGGPSFTSIPLWEYTASLHELATFIIFDQRGTGKTYYANKDKITGAEEIILDLKELITMIKSRYQKEQVILMGHSWGSIVAEKYISQYPNDVEAYIGVGQVINFKKGVSVAFEKAKQLALTNKDRSSCRKLNRLSLRDDTIVKDFPKVVSILGKYGYAMNTKDVVIKMIKSKLFDFQYLISMFSSSKANYKLLDYLENYNLMNYKKEYTMPYFYILGKRDYQVSYTIALDYFQQIESPLKQCFILENSNHMPMIEEPEKFRETLEEILRLCE